jgi:hypothetical protein
MGYVHCEVSKPIPCVNMMPITGAWTEIAGQVTGTIAKHKAAATQIDVLDAVANFGVRL